MIELTSCILCDRLVSLGVEERWRNWQDWAVDVLSERIQASFSALNVMNSDLLYILSCIPTFRLHALTFMAYSTGLKRIEVKGNY
jgi:hypothetical protein